jgi:hypothetical protein
LREGGRAGGREGRGGREGSGGEGREEGREGRREGGGREGGSMEGGIKIEGQLVDGCTMGLKMIVMRNISSSVSSLPSYILHSIPPPYEVSLLTSCISFSLYTPPSPFITSLTP